MRKSDDIHEFRRHGDVSEFDCWARASESLATLSTVYANQESLETIGRVNRLLSAWPSDDTVPAEGFDSLKSTYKKLTSGLSEIKSNAEREAK
jgi:SAGA-associated factor 29